MKALGLLLMFTLIVPPAAKVLAIVGVVYPLIQAIKKIPGLAVYLKGWVAILLNIVLCAGGILIEVPPNQLYTTNTLLALVTAILGAAGIHGTISAMSAPQVLATTPPYGQVKKVPAILEPADPANVPVDKSKL